MSGRAHSVASFQALKIQRSVGRAKDGATFPLSIKLKSRPGREEAAGGPGAPPQGYWASVWAFSTVSGLVTLLPDGTIYGINHSFALTLFGYGKSELLGKVGPPRGVLVRAPQPSPTASASSRPACRPHAPFISLDPTPSAP